MKFTAQEEYGLRCALNLQGVEVGREGELTSLFLDLAPAGP